MLSLGKVCLLRQTSINLSLRGFCSLQQLNKFSHPIQSVIIVSKHKPSLSLLSSLINNNNNNSSSIFSKNNYTINCCRFYCSSTTTPSSSPTVKSSNSSVPAKKDEQKPAVRTVDPYKLTAQRKAGLKETDRSEPTITESMIEDAVLYRSDGKIMSFEEKVWENTATPGYAMVILVGVGLILTVFYNLWMEFWSKNSPNSIYSSSFKLVAENQEVQDLLGTPIKAYGEETRRGYRRHVSHQIFYNQHIRHIRVKYYVQGPLGKGTVHLEKLATDKHGDFDTYSFLVVDVQSPLIRIVIEPKNLEEEEQELARLIAEEEEEEAAAALSGK